MCYLQKVIVAAFMLVAVSAYAESEQLLVEPKACAEPGLLALPEGNKASSDEMLLAQQEVSAYVERTKQFLQCLLHNEQLIGDALTYEQKKTSITQYNLAVARMQRLVEGYNQQLKAYQLANSEQS